MRAHERMKKLLFTNHFSSTDPNSIFSSVQSPGEIDNFFFFKFHLVSDKWNLRHALLCNNYFYFWSWESEWVFSIMSNECNEFDGVSVWLVTLMIGNPAKRTMTDWDGCQCDAILFRWRKYFLFDIIWMPPLWCLLGNLARRKARATVINIVPLIFAEPLHPASSYETFFWNFNPSNIWCHNYFILLHTNTLDLSQLQQLKIISTYNRLTSIFYGLVRSGCLRALQHSAVDH